MGEASRTGPKLIAAVVAAIALPALAAPAPSPAQQLTPCDMESHEFSRVSRAPQNGFLPAQVVHLESDRDGKTIEMGLVRPDVPEGTRVPVIAVASPYFHPLGTVDLRRCRPELTENFVPQGYAVALIAVRGSADSGGCFDFFGPAERGDLDQAVTWLGEQPWSTGAVGMVGKSYDGGTPWEVAAEGNPHLRTIVPISGVPDVFDLLFRRGVPDYRGPGVISAVYYAESIAFYLPGRAPEHTVEVTACPDYATAIAAGVHSAFTGEPDPFGYWAARRHRDDVEEKYRGSVLLVQGLQDWNVNPGVQYPWISALEEHGVTVKHLLGQWGHSHPDDGDERTDWADLLLAWFDRWLYGRTGADTGPPAEVQDSEGRWRAEEGWPPAGTPRTLFLEPGGRLAAEAGQGRDSRTLGPDPVRLRFGDNYLQLPEPLGSVCEQPLCAAFESAPFEEGLRLAGLPHLNLRVTPLGPLGQVSAYLYAVDGEGATRVGWGQADVRFPQDEDARPVEPGRSLDLRLDLQPLDAVVPPGGHLALAISQGTAYNRLPGQHGLPMSVEVGGGSGSLELTTVEPDPADFFDPPR